MKPGVLLCLGHGDSWALGVIEAVHGAELHDHVQAVCEHQDHEKTGHQPHPDTRREEACTVTGVRELAAGQVKALDLKVFKRDPPLIGWIFRGAWDEQGPAEAGDRLTAVRVLSRGVNVSAAVKCGFGAVVLQLHSVQCEPAACRYLVVTLAHSKDQFEAAVAEDILIIKNQP